MTTRVNYRMVDGVPVNVLDFGADPTGVTDSAPAFQLAAQNGISIIIPDGTFLLNTAVDFNVNGQTIKGTGTVKAGTLNQVMFQLSGDDQKLSGITFNGDNKAVRGVEATGSNVDIQFNTFQSFDSTVGGTKVIAHINNNRGTISNNKFYDIFALTSGSIGDAASSARAIWISGSTDRDEWVVVENNYIDNVGGLEGDAIHVQLTSGGLPYQSGKVRITNNFITKCTRRGIKLQAKDIEVKGNTYLHDLSQANSPDFAACVESIGAGDVNIDSNILDGIQGICVIVGGAGFNVENITVRDNTMVTGYAESGDPGWNKSSQRQVFLDRVNVAKVSGNKCTGGRSSCIFAQDSSEVSASDNKFQTELTSDVGTCINFTDCTNCEAIANVGRDDNYAKIYMVSIDNGSGHVIQGNHARYPANVNHATGRVTNSPTNVLMKDNSSQCNTFATVVGTGTNIVKLGNVNMGAGSDGNDTP